MTQETAPSPLHACHWCGTEFSRKRNTKLFCCQECKVSFNNAMTVIGRRVIAEAMAWRRARGVAAKGGADAFQRMCGLLDEANAEFVAIRPKGSPSINDYIRARNSAQGLTFGKDRGRRHPDQED